MSVILPIILSLLIIGFIIILALLIRLISEQTSFQKQHQAFGKFEKCNHISAGGTFLYDCRKGEGPGAIRQCTVCGYTEECYNPDPADKPHYVQWKPPSRWGKTARKHYLDIIIAPLYDYISYAK